MNSIITKIIHWKRFKKSLRVACQGISFAIKREENFRLMVVGAGLAIFLACYLPLNISERALIFLAIAGVLGMELINAQIEKVLNLVQPNKDERVKQIKDLSAAAVLIMVIGSIILGIIIFLPKILQLFF
ncbi:diacylglycerol kinase family protein [bacterium]|nr:diacylglycerol kinase family protein [bacterium]